jgi:hypothetical protein
MQAFLADLIVVVHLGYLGFVVIGELLIVSGFFFNWDWVRNSPALAQGGGNFPGSFLSLGISLNDET